MLARIRRLLFALATLVALALLLPHTVAAWQGSPIELNVTSLEIVAGLPMSATFTASGGVAPYTYAAPSIPSGLSLRSDGVLSGTVFGGAGHTTMQVVVTDSVGQSQSFLFLLYVQAPGIVIDLSGMPQPVAGQPYYYRVTVSGGQAPYTFSTYSSSGYYTISSNGVISGIGAPPEVGYVLDFSVTDARGNTAYVEEVLLRSVPAGEGPPSMTAPELEVLALVNVERAKVGCQPLRADNRLAAAADSHSLDMATNNWFSHAGTDGSTASQRIAAAGYSARVSAENIAAGNASPALTLAQWMNSPPHKAALLNCNYVDAGVGYAANPSATYTHYWTMVFAAPLS